MTSGLVLILVVAGAYLAAHVAFEYLAKRFLIVSGAEYLVLGILLGPEVSGLIRTNVVDSFGPFLVLAIGWMGAAIGAQFHLPTLLRVRGPFYQVAFLQTVLSLGVVGAAMTATFAWVTGEPWHAVVVPGVVLGCIAAASTLTGLRLVAHRRLNRRVLVRQIEVASGMDAAVAITGFSILLCLFHAAPPAEVRPPTPTEWVVVSILIGCLGGALFHLFLGQERDRDRLFISLVGAITLASGAAAFTRLSPLLPTMLIGAILVNTTRNRYEIKAVLSAVQRPIHFLLLVFAGAAWTPVESVWIIPILLFFVVRIFAKVGSARIAARVSGLLPALGPHWGRALLGQGSLATAIALNYRLYDTSALPNVVFTAALVSVLLTDLLSARFVRAALLRHQRESGGVEMVPVAEAEHEEREREEARERRKQQRQSQQDQASLAGRPGPPGPPGPPGAEGGA